MPKRSPDSLLVHSCRYCMGTHSLDKSSVADISERLRAEMEKLPHQPDAAQSPTETIGRRLQQHHGIAADGSLKDAMLQDLMKMQPTHGVANSAASQQRKNPTSWTQWCEKNRGTPELVPGSGLVRAHFFMSGSARE